MTLVIVGAAAAQRMQESVGAFEAAGFTRVDSLDEIRSDRPDEAHISSAKTRDRPDDRGNASGDFVLGVAGDGAELLREADRRGIKYVLVHDGEHDGHRGGTFDRAHHRIEAAERHELAQRLRSRERPLVTCVAFGYKHGAPADATLLVDARFLDNPYWVPELKDLTGHEAPVVEFVLKQPAAKRLLDHVERIVRDLAPLYAQKGRMNLVVAFGCTGGQHRSVVLAAELARRLRDSGGMDVAFTTRDLE